MTGPSHAVTGPAGAPAGGDAGAVPVEGAAGAVPVEDAAGPRPGDAGGGPARAGGRVRVFEVTLDNFAGPFDLLLQLISKHELDVTEVALSRVTDDFIAHIRRLGAEWDLGQATEFLVVAATLLDLKAARLLPAAEVEDEEDLALLEARDLLFARLLQYRAYRQVAEFLAARAREASRRWPRAVSLEPRFAEALPEVLLGIGVEEFARIAAHALAPRPVPTVSVAHLHTSTVSVREHAALLRERLGRMGSATFRTLCADCQSTLEVVARFLAVLELYREGAVGVEQMQPLGDLHVRWIGGSDGGEIDEYDDQPGTEPAAAGTAGDAEDEA